MKPNILMPIMTFMIRFYNIFRKILRISSVSDYSVKALLLSIVALVAIFIGSCQKDTLKIGDDILPNSDFVSINSTDTLSIFSYTMFDDSIRTDHPLSSYLGQLYDPYFGSTSAGFVSQIRLNTKWDGLPFTVDSVKLILHILTTKGGSSDIVHSISIYEIADQLSTDSAYYSKRKLNLTGFKVTDIDLPTLRTDTINDVALRLPGNGVEFGNYILRDTSMLFYNNNIPDFRSYFKGLYFAMNSSTEPLLLSLSTIYQSTSGTYYNYFEIFGHDADDAFKEYAFILDAKNTNATYNKYTHDFSTATLGDKMAHRNTTYRDNLSYLQALNGVYTKISLPGLEKLKNDGTLSNVAINRARLIVPIEYTFTGANYYAKNLPQTLRLRYKVKNSARYDVPDYTMGSSTVDLSHNFFDGKLDSVANVYKFNIPTFIQAYLKDDTNTVKPELEIYEGAGTNNVIFKANKNKIPLKFEFAFTKF
jgi:hypothetical protein